MDLRPTGYRLPDDDRPDPPARPRTVGNRKQTV